AREHQLSPIPRPVERENLAALEERHLARRAAVDVLQPDVGNAVLRVEIGKGLPAGMPLQDWLAAVRGHAEEARRGAVERDERGAPQRRFRFRGAQAAQQPASIRRHADAARGRARDLLRWAAVHSDAPRELSLAEGEEDDRLSVGSEGRRAGAFDVRDLPRILPIDVADPTLLP